MRKCKAVCPYDAIAKKSAHVKMPVVWERLFLTNTAVPILTQKNVCPAECVW